MKKVDTFNFWKQKYFKSFNIIAKLKRISTNASWYGTPYDVGDGSGFCQTEAANFMDRMDVLFLMDLIGYTEPEFARYKVRVWIKLDFTCSWIVQHSLCVLLWYRWKTNIVFSLTTLVQTNFTTWWCRLSPSWPQNFQATLWRCLLDSIQVRPQNKVEFSIKYTIFFPCSLSPYRWPDPLCATGTGPNLLRDWPTFSACLAQGHRQQGKFRFWLH